MIRFLVVFLSVLLLALQTFHVEVSLVTVGVTVTDRNGDVVSGLTAEDFSILEEGNPCEIAFFSSDETPINLGILLDRSDSMIVAEKFDRAKEAAIWLVKSSHPETEFSFLPFNEFIPPMIGYTGDRRKIESQINEVQPGGGTRLYDTIITTLKRSGTTPMRRQALVIITDGADQHSSQSLNETLQAVQTSQTQVYIIGYFSKNEDETFKEGGAKISLIYDLKKIDNPRIVFKRLAEESGAEAFFPRSDEDLRRAAENILRDLRQQYTLAFYPPADAQPGSYRNLEVRVKRRDLKVRARPGYKLTDPKQQ